MRDGAVGREYGRGWRLRVRSRASGFPALTRWANECRRYAAGAKVTLELRLYTKCLATQISGSNFVTEL